MEQERFGTRERAFSLDLNSKAALRTASFGNGQGDRVTIEGTIGAFKQVEFVEDAIFELTGTKGVLRVDLSREDLANTARNHAKGETR